MSTVTREAPPVGAPRYVPLAPGTAPIPGQVVYLTGDASPQFASNPLLLLVGSVEPSSVDASRGRTPAESRWLYLTGWELDTQLRRTRQRTLLACAAGVLVRT